MQKRTRTNLPESTLDQAKKPGTVKGTLRPGGGRRPPNCPTNSNLIRCSADTCPQKQSLAVLLVACSIPCHFLALHISGECLELQQSLRHLPVVRQCPPCSQTRDQSHHELRACKSLPSRSGGIQQKCQADHSRICDPGRLSDAWANPSGLENPLSNPQAVLTTRV